MAGESIASLRIQDAECEYVPMDAFVGWVMRHRILIGVFLLILGIGASVLLAFGASSADPPDGAQSALIVVLGGLFNLGGAWAVSRRPGAPNLIGSRVAVRHLAIITKEVGRLAEFADKAFESKPAGKGREELGKLSWKLSDIEGRLVTNVEDWAKVYPDLVDDESRGTSGEELEAR